MADRYVAGGAGGAAYISPAGAGVNTKIQGVYWIGQDGQVYVKGPDGTNAAGAADANTAGYWESRGFEQIPDPVAKTGTNGLSATGSGDSGPTYKDTTAARDAQGVSIASLDTIFNNALTGADSEYNNLLGRYDVEDATNLRRYGEDVEGNEISRDESTQKGLLGAARGSRGLYATLASLGALGGTGRLLANRAISNEANADLGETEKSFKTNTKNLYNTRETIEREEKQRRLDAESTWKTNRQNAEYDYYKGNEDMAKEMAGLWSDAGNFGEAANWLKKSSGYTPEVAKRTKVNPKQYANESLTYSTPAMNKYLGGMNSTAVNVAAGNPINGAIYTSTRKRDEL